LRGGDQAGYCCGIPRLHSKVSATLFDCEFRNTLSDVSAGVWHGKVVGCNFVTRLIVVDIDNPRSYVALSSRDEGSTTAGFHLKVARQGEPGQKPTL